tara:strand:- start:2885 stop:3535 length:651 start_codon:yes stop_codon:yes gene_type:complete
MSITARHEGLFEGVGDYTFHMLGCGAIGSSAALQLARMGAVHFHLYDRDKVEDVNIGVSQYIEKDINKEKVNALKEHLLNISSELIIDAHNGDFDEFYFQDHNDIVILGFDSMKSRLEAVTTICSNSTTRPKCIIDGRMGAEHYQQYIFKKPTLNEYMKYWYSDEHGDEEPCNAKATSYCSYMSGSFIANSVRKFITNAPLNGNFSFHFPTMMIEK